MNRILKQSLGLLIVLLNIGNALAQEEIPLVQVLESLEERYTVDFNYDPQLVAELQTEPITEGVSLNAALEILRNNTKLRFTVLDDTTISVLAAPAGFNVCGYLKNKDNQQALAFASIQVNDKAAISDEQGYFELNDINPEAVVSIKYLGYRSIERQAKFFRTSCEPVYMLVSQQSLTEVLLQQYLVKGVDKLNTGEYRFDFDRFSILPGLIEADVLQAVQAFPGIQSVNETVSNINIRGGSHDQNLIQWDDIKMYQSGHFFGLISVFNPQMNQEVLLTQNGSMVEATDGVSGTIAMRTSKRINPKLRINAGVNLINADVFADIPISQNSSLQLAGRKSLSDFVRTPTFNAYFDRIAQNTEITQQQANTINTDQNFDFYDASMRYLHRITDKDLLRLNFILINNKLVFDENTLLETSVETRQSQITQNSIAGGLQYIRDWSTNLQTEIQVYNTDYKLEAVNANIERAQRFLQENSVSETGAKALVNWQFAELFGLSGGYQFIETKVRNLDDVDNPIFRRLKGEVLRVHSGFSAIRLNSSLTNWSGRLGVRYNYISEFDKHIIEPRLRLGYAFSPDFSAEVLGEFKHQLTTQIINFQNDFLGVEKRRWQLADDLNIPVLESKQGSFGLNYNKDQFLANATIYYKEVDGITTQSQGFLNQFEFEKESGSYAAYGLEVLIRQNIWRLQLWTSYSYLDNQYDFPSLLNETFSSNFDITHTAGFGIAYDHKGLKASVGANWHSGRPYTAPIEEQEIIAGVISYGFPNMQNVEDYLRVDASASYRFKAGRMRFQLAASVWNLLDSKNELNRFFTIESNEIAQVNQSSLGLVPNLAVRVYY